jgi:hypothetical protein
LILFEALAAASLALRLAALASRAGCDGRGPWQFLDREAMALDHPRASARATR